MIEFKHIDKRFQLKNGSFLEVLNDFNLRVEKNDLLLIKGVSGCGKSTILNICAALQKPNFGEIIVNGESISKLSDSFASEFRLKNIGFIFQKHNLLTGQSVLQNLAIPLLVSNYTLSQIEKKSTNLLDKFELLNLKDEPVENLSGGESARVAILRALMNDANIILADEPTANLDLGLSELFISYMHLLKDEGKTIIISTHDDIFEKKCNYTNILNLKKRT